MTQVTPEGATHFMQFPTYPKWYKKINGTWHFWDVDGWFRSGVHSTSLNTRLTLVKP